MRTRESQTKDTLSIILTTTTTTTITTRIPQIPFHTLIHANKHGESFLDTLCPDESVHSTRRKNGGDEKNLQIDKNC